MTEDRTVADRAVRDVRRRLSSLRDACGAPSADAGALLDAAMLDLEWAAAEMTQLAAALRTRAEMPMAAAAVRDRERELLRRLFLATPVPTLLISSTGEIRRGNRAAADLFDLPLGYLTGKPFYSFLDPATVALSRARMGAVVRSGERQALIARVRQSGGPINVEFTLEPFHAPGQAETDILLVGAYSGGLPERERDETDTGREAERSWQTAHALDLSFGCARMLLEAVQRSPKEAERMLARQLTAHFADWALVDCIEADDSLRRAGVSGPDGEDALADLVANLDGDGNVAAQAVRRTGESLLQVHPDDPTLLGTLPDGRTVIGAIGAGSLLVVPFGHEERIIGVLSTIRAADRGYFTLNDQRVVSELAGLLGLSIAIRDAS